METDMNRTYTPTRCNACLRIKSKEKTHNPF